MKINEVLEQAISSEKFNSNNDWGFGGAIGVRYYFKNGYVLTIATAYYRHLNPQKFFNFRHKNKIMLNSIFDVTKIDKSHIEIILNLIQ